MRTTFAFVLLMLSVACSQNDGDIWTLYRDSEIAPNARIHVATFDADEEAALSGPSYNQASCNETAQLYASNDSASKNWWCEPGRFRP
jgi:hypothetical protein